MSTHATTYPVAGTFTVAIPTGATNLRVQLWGGGGGGVLGTGGGGGGGSAYSEDTFLAPTPGNHTLVVGAGGGGGSGTGVDGSSSTWDATSVVAVGGGRGMLHAGGTGGASGSCIGSIKYSGGGGASDQGSTGGGGGSSAGTASNGTTATTVSGAVAPTGGGNGGNGAGSGASASDGSSPGGGGGGTKAIPPYVAGNGAPGKAIVTYDMVRTPAAFTKYIPTGICGVRQPIVTTTWDDIVNDQQLANTTGQLIASAVGLSAPPYPSVPPPLVVAMLANQPPGTDGLFIPSLLGKNSGSGTCSIRVFVYATWVQGFGGGASTPVGNVIVGTRANHASLWTYTTSAQVTWPNSWGWVDMGADVAFPNGGDLFVGISNSTAQPPNYITLMNAYAVFAQAD